MLKHSIVTSLAVAAVVTTAIAFTAFASETRAEAARSKTVDSEVSVIEFSGEDAAKAKASMPDMKTDDQGRQYYVTEDGVIITLVPSSETGEDGKAQYEITMVPAK